MAVCGVDLFTGSMPLGKIFEGDACMSSLYLEDELRTNPLNLPDTVTYVFPNKLTIFNNSDVSLYNVLYYISLYTLILSCISI